MKGFFSYKGRINRIRYVARVIPIAVVAGILYAFFTLMSFEPGGGSIFRFLAAGTLLLAEIVLFATRVKRLHDIGRPGSHYWLFLAPFYSFYLGILLLVLRGEEGANEFGEDPLVEGDSDAKVASNAANAVPA